MEKIKEKTGNIILIYEHPPIPDEIYELIEEVSTMNSNITQSNKLKIFFSYSTNDKKIVGFIKDSLEQYGFEVFTAHDEDAIEPALEWREEIIDAIKKCNVFIPLISNNFKDSEYTDQEIGMAIIRNDIFIIPLELDAHPYGFIGNIQSLKFNMDKIVLEKSYIFESYFSNKIPYKIYNLIKRRPEFEKYMIDIFIKELSLIGTFAMADAKIKEIEEFKNFTSEQVYQICQITKGNRQIHDAYYAKKVLNNFFNIHKGHLGEDEYTKIIELLDV